MLTRPQAFALYTLLSQDSSLNNYLTVNGPYATASALTTAMNMQLLAYGIPGAPFDFSGEGLIAQMIKLDGSLDLSPEQIHNSLEALVPVYSGGSCPRTTSEMLAIWNGVANSGI